jgi:predicted O-methyltransferase YrrM
VETGLSTDNSVTLKERVVGRSQRAKRTMMKRLFELPAFSLEEKFGPKLEGIRPIPEWCCMPPYLGPKSHDDFEPLMRIVRKLRPSVVIELGTAYGNTVANICREAPDARIYTVNALPDEQSGDLVTCELSKDEIGSVFRKSGYGGRVTQIYENTLHLNLSQYMGGDKADLAIVDACHDTDYVMNDFYKVKPFVRPGGIVLFHDTHPSMEGHLEGSYMACMKLRARGYDILHIPDTWWGIWQAPERKR